MVRTHSFLNSALDRGGQLYSPAALPRWKTPCTQWIGSSVDPRAGLDVSDKTNTHCSYRNSNSGPSSPWTTRYTAHNMPSPKKGGWDSNPSVKSGWRDTTELNKRNILYAFKLIYSDCSELSMNNCTIYSSLFVPNVHQNRIKEAKETRHRKMANYYYLKLEK